MNTEHCGAEVGCCKHFCGIKCISWSAIIVAAFVAIGLSFLLILFSTAIGVSIYKVSPEGVHTLAVGGMLAFAIGIIASMFFAGWIAGHFGRSHCEKKCCGGLYGFATWCVALVLMILLALPFTRFVTGYTHYLANTPMITTTVASATNATPAVTVQSTVTPDDISKGAFVVFLMFFLGALASTVGGHIGVMSCCDKECCKTGKCGECK